jgi:hypothetical protein
MERLGRNPPLDSRAIGASRCVAIVPTLINLGKSSETIGGGKTAAALLGHHQHWQQAMRERSQLWARLEGLDRAQQLDSLARGEPLAPRTALCARGIRRCNRKAQ